MKAYLNSGLLFKDRDIAIMTGLSFPAEIEIDAVFESKLIQCDIIHVNPDYSHHNTIEVQIGNLSNKVYPEDINHDFGYFEIEVQIFENSETDLKIVDRYFKLDDLSMDLQKRIHDVSELMRIDKMKYLND